MAVLEECLSVLYAHTTLLTHYFIWMTLLYGHHSFIVAYIIILLSFNLMPFLFCFSQNQERPWAPTSDFDGTICHPFFAADISLMSSHVARTLLRFRKQCAPDSSAMQLERTLRKATKHLWTTRLCTSTPPVPFLIGNQTGKLQQTHMSSRWSPLSRDPNRTNLCGSVHT